MAKRLVSLSLSITSNRAILSLTLTGHLRQTFTQFLLHKPSQATAITFVPCAKRAHVETRFALLLARIYWVCVTSFSTPEVSLQAFFRSASLNSVSIIIRTQSSTPRRQRSCCPHPQVMIDVSPAGCRFSFSATVCTLTGCTVKVMAGMNPKTNLWSQLWLRPTSQFQSSSTLRASWPQLYHSKEGQLSTQLPTTLS